MIIDKKMNEYLCMFILEYQQYGHYEFAEKVKNLKVKFEEKNEPKILTVQMLSEGFTVWVIRIVISVFVFVLVVFYVCIIYASKIN